MRIKGRRSVADVRLSVGRARLRTSTSRYKSIHVDDYVIGLSHPSFHRNTIRPYFAVYLPFISSYHKMLSKDWMLDSLGLYPNLLQDAGKGRYKHQHRMKIRNLLDKKPLTTAAVDSEEKWDVGIGLKRETKQFYMIQLWDRYVKRFQCTVTHILIMVNCRSCLCVQDTYALTFVVASMLLGLSEWPGNLLLKDFPGISLRIPWPSKPLFQHFQAHFH